MSWFKRWKKRQRRNNTLIFRVYNRLRYLFPWQKEKFSSYYADHVGKQLAAFKKYGEVVLPLNQATYYEVGVGAGASLIGLSLAGMHHIIGTDVNRLLCQKYLIANLNQFKKHATRFGLTFPAGLGRPNDTDITSFLHDNFRIDYRAPYSATQTDLPSNSVDYMSSNATFEHIPLGELADVIKEHYRLLKPNGVFYAKIDYHDHSIARQHKRNKDYPHAGLMYGYLRYSQAEWEKSWQNSYKYSYQNRLRTKDYLTLFEDAGFRVLEVIPHQNTPYYTRLRELAKVDVDPCFAHYTTDELLEEGCNFILTKPSAE